MSTSSEELFVFLLQVSGFSKEDATRHLAKFKKLNKTMEEFSKEYLADKCKTLFLKRILIRFSKVYDDEKLRKKMASVIGEHVSGIKGDLHVHTNWSDGTYPIESYVKKAEEMKYKYLAITDHSLVGKGTVQMDGEKFLKEMDYIDEIQEKTSVRIIKGVELDINEDGSLDYADEVIEKADFVLGAVHFDYGKGREKAFELLKSLLKKSHVNVIAHPLNKIGKRIFQEHLEEIVELAKKNKKVLEISLVPDRMEESDFLVRSLKNAGMKFSFGTDSHSVKQMELMSLSKLWIDELDKNSIANFYEDPLEFMEA